MMTWLIHGRCTVEYQPQHLLVCFLVIFLSCSSQIPVYWLSYAAIPTVTQLSQQLHSYPNIYAAIPTFTQLSQQLRSYPNSYAAIPTFTQLSQQLRSYPNSYAAIPTFTSHLTISAVVVTRLLASCWHNGPEASWSESSTMYRSPTVFCAFQKHLH